MYLFFLAARATVSAALLAAPARRLVGANVEAVREGAVDLRSKAAGTVSMEPLDLLHQTGHRAVRPRSPLGMALAALPTERKGIGVVGARLTRHEGHKA